MNRKSAFQLSISFVVMIIIAIVVFSFSVYIVKKFFTHAEDIKLTYDERTEQEIERLLDDGSRVAVPRERKTIVNGNFDTFGVGILNVIGKAPRNEFMLNVSFSKAFDKKNVQLCDILAGDTYGCGSPQNWLQTFAGTADPSGAVIKKVVKNNEQEKFLLGVDVNDAPSGTYIFNLDVSYLNDTDVNPSLWHWVRYDVIHKLYVDVP